MKFSKFISRFSVISLIAVSVSAFAGTWELRNFAGSGSGYSAALASYWANVGDNRAQGWPTCGPLAPGMGIWICTGKAWVYVE